MQDLRGVRAIGRLLVPLHVQRDPLANVLSRPTTFKVFLRRFASRRAVAMWWFRLPLFFLGCGFFGPRLLLGYLVSFTR